MAGYIVDKIMAFIASLDTSITLAYDVLIKNIFDDKDMMFLLADTIGKAIRPFAVTILGLCFMIEFLKIILNDDLLKWQTGFKTGAKLVLTYVALDISSDLMKAIYITVANLITMATDKVGEIGNPGNGISMKSTMGETVKDQLQKAIEGLTVLQAIGLLATIGIGFLIIWLVGIIIMVLAYGRAVELLMHIAVAPIPCAFLILDGHHASRIFWKFIMSFAANCLQGFFIILSIALYNALVVQIFANVIKPDSDVTAITGGLLLGTIVLLVTVVKSGSLAKQILEV